VKKALRRIVRAEAGQGLIEYTLIVAFIALGSAVLFEGAGRRVKGIWKTGNSRLAVAKTKAKKGY
jgi:Flp pilus assembly pilin Flp